MGKLGIKNKYLFCYSVLESTEKGFIHKINDLNSEKNCVLELRIDYLFASGLMLPKVIELINKAHTISKHKLIVTIRTVGDGGRIDLTKENYYYYIKNLYLYANVSCIDVEYRFYKIDKEYYDNLFKKRKKDIIISMHIFDKIFTQNEYKKMFNELMLVNCNILKFAIKVYSKQDLINFMLIAKKFNALFKKSGKNVVMIAMGKVGSVSRLLPEFTGTKIVYLDAYQDTDNDLGQFSRIFFNKYRKLLEKKLKT